MANQKSDSDLVSDHLKKQWRYTLKKVRESLNPIRREQASSEACLKLNEWCKTAQFVLSFASFGSEIQLWSFNHQLASEGRLILPLIVNKQLQLFLVLHLDQLEINSLNFLEPKRSHCEQMDFSLIEIALIPGLGFDLQTRYRLGYGQGYYDRLLATSSSPQAWGIGFLEQAVVNLPHSSHDIAMRQIHLF